YPQAWLDELLAEGALFEGWSHEACFVPIEHYPLHRRMQRDGLTRAWGFIQRTLDEHQAEAAQMLAHIRQHGPVMSADFVRGERSPQSGWWNWKLEKRVLELLFATGELMIARRKNFQRVYDLRERVVPWWDDAQTPPLAEVLRQFALETVRALGVTTPRWQADYFRLKKPHAALLAPLAAEGALIAVQIEGFAEQAYVHPSNAALAEQAAAGTLTPTHTTLLSPFDPLVWDRQRALELWGFDYRIECYTPAVKRRYGYFTLPILWRGELIGRLDAKAHRKQGQFEIKALHFEPGVPQTAELLDDLHAAIQDFANWHDTPQVVGRTAGTEATAARGD
ncbi:MAG: YcaQ family DNA glycosylase, partial [Roseiflexaceae bacterium]|nr:YcaQ family DNA glycosylase [Roseiflexaceae bacterium]